MFDEDPVYKVFVFSDTEDFIRFIPEPTKSRVSSAFDEMSLNDFDSLQVKTLRGKVKELIIKRYRFTFFIEAGTIYVVRGFIKKSKKTPIEEIKYAEKQYRDILLINNQNHERNKS
jgi:phage-related protein